MVVRGDERVSSDQPCLNHNETGPSIPNIFLETLHVPIWLEVEQPNLAQ